MPHLEKELARVRESIERQEAEERVLLGPTLLILAALAYLAFLGLRGLLRRQRARVVAGLSEPRARP